MNYPQAGGGWQQIPPPTMPPQPYPGQPYPAGYYTPGYYPPPPPPKKKKTWLWVLLAILTVIVLAVGGFVGFKIYERNRTVTVTYEATGTGSASVMYTGGKSVIDVDLPWTEEVTIPDSKNFQVLVRPGTSGAIVTCTVSIAGKVIVTSTTNTSSATSSHLPFALCQGVA